MAQSDWDCIFQNTAANHLKDSWSLDFDDNIEPHNPNHGWEQYIRKTSAWFKCTMCGRSWPSNRVMVVFNMRLMNGQGTVKVRSFRQNCKRCTSAPMEKPAITRDNIAVLMDNLVEKIKIKCYHENLGQKNRPPRSFDVNSPHEPSHCEACLEGICERNTAKAAY